MSFVKYRSIENHYRQKFIDQIKLNGFETASYVVEEKVHGANFSIWLINDEVKFAKRSGFLGKDEDFYGFRKLEDKLRAKMEKLHSLVPNEQPIAVYGEIFGGNYPHPDVEKDNNSPSVQKGVHYHPSTEFIAFDILFEGDYVDVNPRKNLLRDAGFVYSRSLTVGNLEHCLEYPNKFQTTIPDYFGLPPIEDNFCEGIVIKPQRALYLPDGTRVIIKSKNESFSEKVAGAKQKEPEPLPDHLKTFYEEYVKYINENRVISAVSKIGEVSFKKFKPILEEVYSDTMKDFCIDNQAFLNTSKKEKEKLHKLFKSLAADEVRSYLKKEH